MTERHIMVVISHLHRCRRLREWRYSHRRANIEMDGRKARQFRLSMGKAQRRIHGVFGP